MKDSYIIKVGSYEVYEDYTLEDIKKIIAEKQKNSLKFAKEHLKQSTKEIDYFKNKEYDKIKILDRPYFLENGQEGLDRLEKAIYEEIEHYKDMVKQYSDTTPYRIFKEIK